MVLSATLFTIYLLTVGEREFVTMDCIQMRLCSLKTTTACAKGILFQISQILPKIHV